jgi:hypothetical protein
LIYPAVSLSPRRRDPFNLNQTPTSQVCEFQKKEIIVIEIQIGGQDEKN